MQSLDFRPDQQGKVRDIYDLGDQLLMVASDRISVFDIILPETIPYKGEILTRISQFWFDFFADVVATHFISADVEDLPERFAPYADYLRGRSMLVRKASMYPAECIVRGYLTGSGLKDYQATGTLCGIKLPAGLVEASKFDAPLFTPSTKAEIGDHDENISFERLVDLIGEAGATALRDTTLALYQKAADYAATRGIIIADTKFEFGADPATGTLILADEVLTPDSSRFWPAEGYAPGSVQPSFDKQYVREFVRSTGWDPKSGEEPPALPPEVIKATSAKYIQAFEIITGQPFSPIGESNAR
ncbi:MAG: phosphoribosylaminoimidazolesuccinocarboxamide synthase [Coriobacteriia bacterium]|nr:phosphoribosylaminoimidazolesuccinocarboxamide synthase [Coriobacteriia bacterium]